MTTTVYLIRHGATALNREIPYRLQGRSLDPPLDSIGVEQSRRLSAALSAIPLTAIYVSPLKRANETARWLAEPHRLTPEIVLGLIEASLGRWEGLTWDQARAADPDLYQAFHANPGETPYPDGESFLIAQQRITPVIAGLVVKHPGESIAVVSHNVTNRALLAGLMGIPIDRAREIRQANCGINVVKYDGPSIIVETVNSHFHLESGGA